MWFNSLVTKGNCFGPGQVIIDFISYCDSCGIELQQQVLVEPDTACF